MSTLHEGDRVLISEIYGNFAQKRNLYHNLKWTKTHFLLLGHVGFISSINIQNETAYVTVFHVKNRNVFKLCQTTCEWPLEALEIPSRVHFSCGDSVALSRGKLSVSVGVISKLENLENDESRYSVVSRTSTGAQLETDIKSQQSPYDPNVEKREMFMCPIYAGPRLAGIMREKGNTALLSYKNTIHGHTIDNLMDVVNSWKDDSVSYAKLVDSVRTNPEQVRQNFDGELPLFRAVADDNWNLVVTLLALGADRNAKDSRNMNIIHIAAQRGLDRMLEGVLTLIPKEVNVPNIDGDTPLHLAARNAHAACIDRLLSIPSCQPVVQNEYGDAPLHEVCSLPESSNKKAAISRLLTNSRASIHQCNNNQNSPLNIAIQKGHVSTVEQLVQLRPPQRHGGPRNGVTPLHFAASCANVSIVNTLISLGWEVHRKDKNQKGVLHYAVEKWTGQADKDMARLATIQALIHSGAPSNVVDSLGQTPLHILIQEILKLKGTYPATLIPICTQLVKTNLNLDEMASRLRPHWQLASICFLVANGADINTKDRRGVSPVDLCTKSTLRPIICHLANIKIRSCLPMISLNTTGTFDTAEVTMCTFMCQDNVASVQFMPCGHRVACVDCAQKTALRRCPICYQMISEARDANGEAVLLGCKSADGQERDLESTTVSERVMRKIAEDAAREAKIAVEQEKQLELKALRERLEQLEMETSCAICMDSKIELVFNCGHTACVECAEKLKLCHICRKAIESKQTIYS